MKNYRTPPKPSFYDSVPEGTCRWCNTPVGLTKTGRVSKSRWHKHCFDEYALLFFTTDTRKAVWQRDKGHCAKCTTICDKKGANGWQMDHIKPLVEANDDLNYWRLPNLQTLCKPCHTAKTSLEATQRAQARKLLKS